MARTAKAWLQTSMKSMNSFIAMAGIAMILYGLWMIRVWQRNIINGSSSFNVAPWFIYSFLGIGITLCVIACFGHVAADTANGFFHSCVLLEDPTGRFEDFNDFVDSNFEICQWIGFLIVIAQGFLILIAIVLKTLEANKDSFYERNNDYAQARLPFLNHPVQPPQYNVTVIHTLPPKEIPGI